jgi:hypothetical protein
MMNFSHSIASPVLFAERVRRVSTVRDDAALELALWISVIALQVTMA